MKTIYLSGPITDLTTGQPREGWRNDFLDAETKLLGMGFNVMNPVDIALEVDDAFNWLPCPVNDGSEKPTRADYILTCLDRMKAACESDCLHGVYVIGSVHEALCSHGVRMELLLADILGVPIYAEGRKDRRVNTVLIPQVGFEGIKELLRD